MFLPTVNLTSGQVNRYDYLQAADSATMEDLFTKYIAALYAESIAEDEDRNVVDIDIAGGGDGHTFVVRILVIEASGSTMWNTSQLLNVRGRFWMGSDAEALESYQEAALASLIAASPDGPVTSVAVGLAGAAKGTRFMAFVAGVITLNN
jgi:hypothetical protein